MKDRSKKKERKRRKEGKIIKKGDGKDWVEVGRRRRNCSGDVVR